MIPFDAHGILHAPSLAARRLLLVVLLLLLPLRRRLLLLLPVFPRRWPHAQRVFDGARPSTRRRRDGDW